MIKGGFEIANFVIYTNNFVLTRIVFNHFQKDLPQGRFLELQSSTPGATGAGSCAKCACWTISL